METNPLFPHPFCHPCSHSRFPLFLKAAQHKPRPSQELLKAFFSLPSFLQLLEGKQQPHSPFCAPGLGSWSPPGWWAGEVPRATLGGLAQYHSRALSSSCCWLSMERAPHPAQRCRGERICRAEPWAARGNWVLGAGSLQGGWCCSGNKGSASERGAGLARFWFGRHKMQH